MRLYLSKSRPKEEEKLAEDLPNFEEFEKEIDLSGNQGQEGDEGYKVIALTDLYSASEMKGFEESQFTYFGNIPILP